MNLPVEQTELKTRAAEDLRMSHVILKYGIHDPIEQPRKIITQPKLSKSGNILAFQTVSPAGITYDVEINVDQVVVVK